MLGVLEWTAAAKNNRTNFGLACMVQHDANVANLGSRRL